MKTAWNTEEEDRITAATSASGESASYQSRQEDTVMYTITGKFSWESSIITPTWKANAGLSGSQALRGEPHYLLPPTSPGRHGCWTQISAVRNYVTHLCATATRNGQSQGSWLGRRLVPCLLQELSNVHFTSLSSGTGAVVFQATEPVALVHGPFTSVS